MSDHLLHLTKKPLQPMLDYLKEFVILDQQIILSYRALSPKKKYVTALEYRLIVEQLVGHLENENTRLGKQLVALQDLNDGEP